MVFKLLDVNELVYDECRVFINKLKEDTVFLLNLKVECRNNFVIILRSMNNLPLRFIFSVIVGLFIIAMIINQWLNKELAMSSSKTPVFIVEKMTDVVEVKQTEYDVHSNYPSMPSPDSVKEDILAVKKTERVQDEKIIYEMPINDKYLVE